MEFIDLAAQQRQPLPTDKRSVKQSIPVLLRVRTRRYILGPEVEELETTLAAYVGVITALLWPVVPMLCSLLNGLGVKQVTRITTSSFISTSETIALLGATCLRGY